MYSFYNITHKIIEIIKLTGRVVCGRSPAVNVGSNPTGGMDVFLL
jgi:hypothetical protein